VISVFHSDIIPFEYENAKMWIEIDLVNLNRQKIVSIDFVFDTGATGILLSRETFEELGYGKIKPLKNAVIIGPSMKPVDARFYKIPDFKIVGSLQIHSPIVKVPNKANGCRNLLGQRVLRKRNYYVDNIENWIYFAHSPSLDLD